MGTTDISAASSCVAGRKRQPALPIFPTARSVFKSGSIVWSAGDGADDYPPFSPREVSARVRAVAPAKVYAPSPVVRTGHFELTNPALKSPVAARSPTRYEFLF